MDWAIVLARGSGPERNARLWRDGKGRLDRGAASQYGDIGVDTSGIICVASCRKLVATIGVADLIIVDTPDALLVCNKDHDQDVRSVVHSLESGEGSIKNEVSYKRLT
jgi:hypothetical protein